ncbi:CHRD domain-containing protein [Ferrimonas marina]|uniref:CHRD domain-containing protein n=1 Tax=Ferrimonas marina TaxID=299255 RepID=A0A1M5MLZ9_9GAMM|nr:CHRD domain-containing protein [Ferrimonas marina]SHG77793.1 CHRD domain-containing protein [Ferrimonas marina]
MKPLLPLLLPLLFAPALADNHDSFRAKLSGLSEVPEPVATATRGLAQVDVIEEAGEIDFTMAITRATGIFAGPGAHIHCGTAEENGPVVAFLAGGMEAGLNGRVVVSGTLTEANIVATDCGATLAELLVAMGEGRTYINVHSLANPSGEIRGQLEMAD